MTDKKKWVLVTGAAKGLGAEICKRLAIRGFNIIIHYRTSHEEAYALKEFCSSVGADAACLQGDFSTSDSVELFIEEAKKLQLPISVLINNVGTYAIRGPLASDDAEWKSLFQTNLHAPIALIGALLPTLIEQRGVIINIGVVGINSVPADLYSTAYTAAKLALWMCSKALAKELAPKGVRVNMVSPGILENAVDKQRLQSILPMQRPATLAEVARVITFLLEAESCYITGQNIEVAGGLRLF